MVLIVVADADTVPDLYWADTVGYDVQVYRRSVIDTNDGCSAGTVAYFTTQCIRDESNAKGRLE